MTGIGSDEDIDVLIDITMLLERLNIMTETYGDYIVVSACAKAGLIDD